MSAKFSAYIGVDYSGAATPMSRSATIQVYEGCGNSVGKSKKANCFRLTNVLMRTASNEVECRDRACKNQDDNSPWFCVALSVFQ